MASAYVKLLRSIWADPDFIGLPSSAQRTYLLLISQPNMTAAGVMPFTPARWASLAPDVPETDIRTDIATLAAARFVIYDAATDEIAIRSYARLDEGWRIPNTMKSLVRTLAHTLSLPIRDAVVNDLETHGIRVDATVNATVSRTEALPQQQPKQPCQPDEPSSQQQPRRPAGDNSPALSDLEPAAAAALIDAFIASRLSLSDVRNPGGFNKRLRADVKKRIEEQPEVTAEQLATDVLGLDVRTSRRIHAETFPPEPEPEPSAEELAASAAQAEADRIEADRRWAEQAEKNRLARIEFAASLPARFKLTGTEQ